MNHHRSICVGFFQQTVVQRFFGAVQDFLTCLEEQPDLALQTAFLLLEQFSSAQQHGCVAVVTAGVHTTFYTGRKWQTGLLVNWQGIHICTQQESFITVSDSGKDTAVTDALRLIAHLFQLLTDVGRGLGQVQSQFGVLVEPAAMGNDFRI